MTTARLRHILRILHLPTPRHTPRIVVHASRFPRLENLT